MLYFLCLLQFALKICKDNKLMISTVQSYLELPPPTTSLQCKQESSSKMHMALHMYGVLFMLILLTNTI